MKAFLEKSEKDYLDDFVFISKYELMNRGIDVVDFDGNNPNSLATRNPQPGDICIGSVDACIKFFQLVGIDESFYQYIGFPEELKKYYKRKIETIDVLPTVFTEPFFIKPRYDVKLFTGSVVDSQSRLDFVHKYCKDITECKHFYKSETINIVSEYRCFVSRGMLKGIQWYAGNFEVMLNSKMVKEIKQCIDNYHLANVAYTLDFAVTDKNEIALIEVNDMWAIGSYGLSAKEYVQMTIDRFNQMYIAKRVLDKLTKTE